MPALGILALTVGLIRSETTRDLRTLTAAGATARTRRPLAGVTAGVLGLLSAALGTVAAMLAGAVFAHASIIQTFGNVPWSDVGLLVIGMPLTAAAAGWLLGGNHALVRDEPRPSARTGACLRLPSPARAFAADWPFKHAIATRAENPRLPGDVTLSCHFVTEAPAFSVVADVAIVKGETPAGDRTWLSFPDGTARRAAVHVIHDLPHLVVESVFGLGDGLWGTLAAGGFEPATRAVTRRNARIRLVTDAPFDELATTNWPAHTVAKAAVNAVLNRWGDGPDTPDGVRDRLRRSGPEAAELSGELTDEDVRVAAAGVRRLYRDWAALPVGGTLRATWPLHDSWLRLL